MTPANVSAPGHAPTHDPWDELVVIRRLEVGPPVVERRRISTRYRVTLADRTEEIALMYRYGEDVFDPGKPADRNLAAMVTAQVALNYGLFAEEIVFTGVFDETDQRFLRDMAENTATEITVKKFLEHNPFLRGAATNLPAIKRDEYCRARIRFAPDPAAPETEAMARAARWGPTSAHAILSSGGKDSLLTLGILRELGCETYPLFVNESGRHWLTALNAYRHLEATHPGTRRVWTNADRVFNWFVRLFPFVRHDFQDVRSDEYPIRLWTVAVFLFGTLPLIKKYGIGRVSIGDEYDTSRRVEHEGIPHYDGLYDQSRYFDRALTEYFAAKGWGVEQFSLLRPLSELLVQGILAARYPDLWRHQTSCHAAHVAEGRVHPCGRCEKCRRIVGMLLALGKDPAGCGYTQEQVDRCVAAIATRGVNQEGEAVEHLAFLLHENGVVAAGAAGLPEPRRRDEIMRLRFNDDVSPRDTVPADLRNAVYGILLQHAEGAVRLTPGGWVSHDSLTHDDASADLEGAATEGEREGV